jgi:hypothetical protein
VKVLEAVAILVLVAGYFTGGVLSAVLCSSFGILAEVLGAIAGSFLGLGVGLAIVCLTAKVVFVVRRFLD